MSDLAYDPSTPLGYVRLLINDKDNTEYLFTDAELTAFLSQAKQNVYMAAAVAVGTILITKGFLLSKVIKRQGYESESHAIKDLIAIQTSLKSSAIDLDGVSFGEFDITDEHFESYRPEWRDPIQVVIE